MGGSYFFPQGQVGLDRFFHLKTLFKNGILYFLRLSLSHIEICLMIWNMSATKKLKQKKSVRGQILFHSTEYIFTLFTL